MNMKDRFRKFNSGRAVLFLVALIAVFMTGAVLKITAVVFIPLFIALLLALVLSPMVLQLGRFKVPRFIAIVLAGLIIIAALVAIGIAIYSSAHAILAAYPRYESRITEIYIWLANFFDFSYDGNLSVFQNLWSQLGVRSQIRLYTISLSNTFISFLKDAVMVALFVVFFLFETVFIREKLSTAFEGARAKQIQKISTDIMLQVSRYLSIKFVISLFNGLVVALFLSLAGLEFAPVWGIIQFIANFIPVLGSIAVGVAASVLALLQFWPDPGPVILVVVIMLGTNMIIGNILDPKIMGDGLGLSPITILISLVVWGYIWGFAGMVIAVPMMVIIKIICENFPVLEPISIMLGSRRSVMAKKVQYEREAMEEAKDGAGGKVE
ncbi:MAG: AI-2E family transporter [Treponema sp.]|nr:AI-2E family transporter [Treponema sp.]